MSKSEKIRRFLQKGKTATEIAKTLKVDPNYVYTVKWYDKKKKKKQPIKEDKKAIAWGKKNPWFGVDKAKTAFALGLHEKLVNDGVDPKSDTYYKKVDAGMKPLLATSDLVNHPPHYKAGGIETIDFIEAKDLNYRLGNVVKYVSRAGRKAGSDPVQDLEKAAFYLQREIEARRNA